jgi:hypothetical protein
MRMMPNYFNTILRSGVVALLAAATGCGPSPSNVSGKVTYRGQALGQATVSFFGNNGEIHSTLADMHGEYNLTNVPAGSYKVAVQSHPPIPPGLIKMQPPGSTYSTQPVWKAKKTLKSLLIPPNYADPEKSGLVVMLIGGNQTFDIDLGP